MHVECLQHMWRSCLIATTDVWCFVVMSCQPHLPLASGVASRPQMPAATSSRSTWLTYKLLVKGYLRSSSSSSCSHCGSSSSSRTGERQQQLHPHPYLDKENVRSEPQAGTLERGRMTTPAASLLLMTACPGHCCSALHSPLAVISAYRQ
jgi:hypothetical protein